MKFQRDRSARNIPRLARRIFALVTGIMAGEKPTPKELIALADALRAAGLQRPSIWIATIAYKRAQTKRDRFFALQVKATAQQYRFRYRQAQETFQKAIAIAPNELYRSYALQHYGKCLVELGKYKKAEHSFLKALEIREAEGKQSLVESSSRALAGLANLYRTTEQVRIATPYDET